MKADCRKIVKQIDSWLAADEMEKKKIRKHVSHCASCDNVLKSTEQVLTFLKQTEKGYEQLKYGGSIPDFKAAGRRQISWNLPKSLWGLAATAMAAAIVWLGAELQNNFPEPGKKEDVVQLRIPSLPSSRPQSISLRLKEPEATVSFSQLDRKRSKLLLRPVKMPKKPSKHKKKHQAFTTGEQGSFTA